MDMNARMTELSTLLTKAEKSNGVIEFIPQVGDFVGVFAGVAQFLADTFVPEFGQGLGGFYTQAMQVEIFGVLSGLEQALGFYRCPGAHGDQGQPDDVHFS